jgi:hypothetical protein
VLLYDLVSTSGCTIDNVADASAEIAHVIVNTPATAFSFHYVRICPMMMMMMMMMIDRVRWLAQ